MKYGIMTFHNIPNMGALLQGLALCKVYRSLGVDCDIIDYECENIVNREIRFHPNPNPIKNIIDKYLLWPRFKKKIDACQRYMNARQVFSKEKYNCNNIKDANLIYDVFISGADMIWNLVVTGYDLNYMLNFVDNNKIRIACGSSVGDSWALEDYNIVQSLLLKYDSIAVRESDTCELIKSMGIECLLVCDPTMLIEPSEWIEQAVVPKEKGYVLVYFGYPEILKSAREYAKREGLKLIIMNWGFSKPGAKSVGPNTPPEWIGYFKNAAAVFTDSYHGLLFSLYLKTPVWTANTGNRIKSLLEALQLENRFVQNDPFFTDVIDFESCHKRISEMREKSLNYISKTIQICSR